VSSPPPSAGAPFPSAPIEPGRAPGGCARGGLIGCGVAAILVLILMAVFVAYVRRKPEALTDLMMGQIERSLAPDVTMEEKEKLSTAYAGFRKRLQEQRVGREPIDRLRAILSSATRGPVRREQVRELTEVFEAASAGPGAAFSREAPAATPAPALSPIP
jgi:hypothetical protein